MTSSLTGASRIVSAKTCTAIQALDVRVEIDGRDVRALIPREVFESCLDTDDQPASWLAALREHADLFEVAIRRRHALQPADFVVLRTLDVSSW